MGKKKNRTPKQARVIVRYHYVCDGQEFCFEPGDRWDIAGGFPGDPGQKTISNELYQYLKNQKILK